MSNRISAPTQLHAPDARRLASPWGILYAFVAKNFKVKYKRSIFGFLWSFVMPLLLTGIYTFVFVVVYRVPKPNFTLFLLSGMLPWQAFNASLEACTGSLVENGAMIRRVYFPKILLPIAAVASNMLHMIPGIAVLWLVFAARGNPILAHLPWLFAAAGLQTLLTIACGLFLSAGNVFFRDVEQVVGILLLVTFFATPIVYDSSQVPEAFQTLLLANPLAPIMQMYRAGFALATPPSLLAVGCCLGGIGALLGLGYLLFRKLSPEIAKEV